RPLAQRRHGAGAPSGVPPGSLPLLVCWRARCSPPSRVSDWRHRTRGGACPPAQRGNVCRAVGCTGFRLLQHPDGHGHHAGHPSPLPSLAARCSQRQLPEGRCGASALCVNARVSAPRYLMAATSSPPAAEGRAPHGPTWPWALGSLLLVALVLVAML